MSGTANDWPFQYQGMEKEFTDPAPYYYSGGGQFYSPQLVRSLSETGQTSSSGTGGGPSPSQLAYGPGSQGNGSFGHWYVNNVLDPSSTGNQLGNLPDIGFASETASYVIPLGAIARIIEEWVSFFEWLFGGSGAPADPRQLLHGRHPLYDWILGLPVGLIATEASAADDPPVYPTVDTAVRGVAPLANGLSSKTGNESGGAIVPSGKGYTYTGPENVGSPCGGHLNLPPYVGSYHTHPATCSGGVPGEPSPDDLDFAAQSRAPVYFITPDGKIYKIQPGGPVVPLQK